MCAPRIARWVLQDIRKTLHSRYALRGVRVTESGQQQFFPSRLTSRQYQLICENAEGSLACGPLFSCPEQIGE